MKKLAIIILFILGYTSQVYAEYGSFLVLKKAYFYTYHKRVLTHIRKAYAVVDITVNKKGNIQYKIIVPENKQVVTGSGYIIENAENLKDLESLQVKVYKELPTIKTDLTVFRTVSAKHLLLTGRKEISDYYPKITWRAVNYKTTIPQIYWIDERSGIYRLNKMPKWLNDTYKESLKYKLSSTIRQKLLSGMIEAGFSSQLVKIALGSPIKRGELDSQNQMEWVYPGKKIIFKNNKVHQVL